MTISLKEFSQAFGEWDYAMRAASYGANGGRDILADAIRNLPTEELEKLRPAIAEAIKNAVKRTQEKVESFGFVFDEPHPTKLRASINDAGSYFYKADRQ